MTADHPVVAVRRQTRCLEGVGRPVRDHTALAERAFATPRAPGRWGMLRLRTVGRRTGEERKAILGYFEDGPDLVTMAMNGWGDAEPAWWLNLLAQPDAVVDLPGGSRAVRGRAASPDERPRLWARWGAFNKDLEAEAALRSRETAVVILSPRPE